MSYEINNDSILEGDKVEYIETKNKDSGLFAEGKPDMVVIHYTAGSSLESAVNTLRDPGIKASTHLVIGREREIKQLIPFNRIAWHAGKSQYQGRSGINQYSIGIEIDNAGRLTKSGSIYTSWFGREYHDKEVFEGVHRNESEMSFWHSYAEQQISCAFSVCLVLKNRFDIHHIVGHEEVSHGRKIDPGPAFPLDKLRQQLFENRGEDEADNDDTETPTEIKSREMLTGKVTATRLNFRSSPSKDAELVSDPLEKGTTLDVIDEVDGWLKVKIPQIGWVKKEYVRLI